MNMTLATILQKSAVFPEEELYVAICIVVECVDGGKKSFSIVLIDNSSKTCNKQAPGEYSFISS